MPTPSRPTATKVATKIANTASTPMALPARLAVAARRKKASAADHEHLAVGEIDQAEHAVDHRVAERDQGIERADRERVDQLLDQESGHDGALVEAGGSGWPETARPRAPPRVFGRATRLGQLLGHSSTKLLPSTL